MSVPPARNAACRKISWCSGTLVLIPSTTISDSALRMRAIAVSRSSPNAMILAISES